MVLNITSEKMIRLNIAIVMPVREGVAPGNAIAVRTEGNAPPNSPPIRLTSPSNTSRFWTIRMVDPATRKMPERKNISMSPLSLPKMASDCLSGSNQRTMR